MHSLLRLRSSAYAHILLGTLSDTRGLPPVYNITGLNVYALVTFMSTSCVQAILDAFMHVHFPVQMAACASIAPEDMEATLASLQCQYPAAAAAGEGGHATKGLCY